MGKIGKNKLIIIIVCAVVALALIIGSIFLISKNSARSKFEKQITSALESQDGNALADVLSELKNGDMSDSELDKRIEIANAKLSEYLNNAYSQISKEDSIKNTNDGLGYIKSHFGTILISANDKFTLNDFADNYYTVENGELVKYINSLDLHIFNHYTEDAFEGIFDTIRFRQDYFDLKNGYKDKLSTKSGLYSINLEVEIIHSYDTDARKLSNDYYYEDYKQLVEELKKYDPEIGQCYEE